MFYKRDLEKVGNKCALCGRDLSSEEGFKLMRVVPDKVATFKTRKLKAGLCYWCSLKSEEVVFFPQSFKYIPSETREKVDSSINNILGCSFRREYGELGEYNLGLMEMYLPNGYKMIHARYSDLERIRTYYENYLNLSKVEESLNETVLVGSVYILYDNRNRKVAIFPMRSMGVSEGVDSSGSKYARIDVLYPLFLEARSFKVSGEMLIDFLERYQNIFYMNEDIHCTIKMCDSRGVARELVRAGYTYNHGDLSLTLKA